MNNSKKKIIFCLKLFFILIIFFLIYKEINGQYSEISNTVSKFNINFFFLSIIFYILSQLNFVYNIYLIYSILLKIKLHDVLQLIFTGQFLDYFPFLGFVYKAKRLKDNFKLSYKEYLSIYVLLLKIGLLGITTVVSLLYLIPIENKLNIKLDIKYYIFSLFFLILIFNFSSNFFFKILKKRKYFFNIFKSKINFFELFSIFFEILNKSFANKLRYLKYILLQISGLIIYCISFIFLFKAYTVEINITDIIFIFMLLNFTTQIKILPKNYGFEELAGSYLIEIATGSFVLGITLMITFRILSLIGSSLLFVLFNIKLNFLK
jgi:uncharacterized membrane protein YbhN (UPF0104 family)